MRAITLVYSYWENPGMLQEHINSWNNFPAEVKENLQVIVTDDCSKSFPADQVFLKLHPSFLYKVFYIEKKIPWNWRMARNVGAKHADTEWILLTDMDHLVPQDTFEYIVLYDLDQKNVYQFERVDAPNCTPYKPHGDSYLMTKKKFWEIGGYDEDFAGTYGTADWPPPSYGVKVKANLKGNGGELIRLPVPLIRYAREVIADASVPRDRLILKGPENDAMKMKIKVMKERTGRGIMVLQSPYRKVL